MPLLGRRHRGVAGRHRPRRSRGGVGHLAPARRASSRRTRRGAPRCAPRRCGGRARACWRRSRTRRPGPGRAARASHTLDLVDGPVGPPRARRARRSRASRGRGSGCAASAACAGPAAAAARSSRGRPDQDPSGRACAGGVRGLQAGRGASSSPGERTGASAGAEAESPRPGRAHVTRLVNVTIHAGHPFAEPEGSRDPVRRFRGRLGGGVTLWTAGAATTAELGRSDGDVADGGGRRAVAAARAARPRRRPDREARGDRPRGRAPARPGPTATWPRCSPARLPRRAARSPTASSTATAWGPRLVRGDDLGRRTPRGVACRSAGRSWSRWSSRSMAIGPDDEPLGHRRGRWTR